MSSKTVFSENYFPGVVAIGASTGGPKALNTLLSKFPKSFPLPIVICQHLPPNFGENLVETIQRGLSIKVVEGAQGMLLSPGIAILAPGGVHMQVKKNSDGSPFVDLTNSPPENNCRPSVDVLFHSVAEIFSSRTVAIILTGMGADGVQGMKILKKCGAKTIAESKETCVVFGMPMEAIKAGVVDVIAPIHDISDIVIQYVTKQRLNT